MAVAVSVSVLSDAGIVAAIGWVWRRFIARIDRLETDLKATVRWVTIDESQTPDLRARVQELAGQVTANARQLAVMAERVEAHERWHTHDR